MTGAIQRSSPENINPAQLESRGSDRFDAKMTRFCLGTALLIAGLSTILIYRFT